MVTMRHETLHHFTAQAQPRASKQLLSYVCKSNDLVMLETPGRLIWLILMRLMTTRLIPSRLVQVRLIHVRVISVRLIVVKSS